MYEREQEPARVLGVVAISRCFCWGESATIIAEECEMREPANREDQVDDDHDDDDDDDDTDVGDRWTLIGGAHQVRMDGDFIQR